MEIFHGAPEIPIMALDKKEILSVQPYGKTDFAKKEIDILIEADQYWSIVKPEFKKSGDGLMAISSALGWIITGPTRESASNATAALTIQMMLHTISAPLSSVLQDEYSSPTETESMEGFDIRAFHAVESLGPGEEEVNKNYEDLITRKPDGRYVGPFPWNGNEVRLKSNREAALKRLFKLREQLSKNKELLTVYHNQIKDLIARNAVVQADDNYEGTHVFMPHRPVLRPGHETTDCRPVFDASARTAGGPSLNNCLETGPNLNPELLATLIRFRAFEVAWIADITKAFHQIELTEEDAEVGRFFWFEDPFDPNSRIICYRFRVVPFGLTCSSFILRAIILKHIKLYENIYPETVQLIRDQLYVDDQLGGACSLEAAIERIKETIIIFSDAKMSLTKWLTNNEELQRHFKGEKMFEKLDCALGKAMQGIESAKALGIKWNAVGSGTEEKQDFFSFNPDAIIEAVNELKGVPTKRQILQISSRIFDPLGLLGAAVMMLKLIFQLISGEKHGWDKEVAPEVDKQWRAFISSLSVLTSVVVYFL